MTTNIVTTQRRCSSRIGSTPQILKMEGNECDSEWREKETLPKYIGFNDSVTMDATKTREERGHLMSPLSVSLYNCDSPDLNGSRKQLFRGSGDEKETQQSTKPNSQTNIWDENIKCGCDNIRYAFPMINGNMPQVWLPEERPITVAKPVVQMNRMWNDMIRMNDDTWIGPDGTGLNGSIHSLCDLGMN